MCRCKKKKEADIHIHIPYLSTPGGRGEGPHIPTKKKDDGIGFSSLFSRSGENRRAPSPPHGWENKRVLLHKKKKKKKNNETTTNNEQQTRNGSRLVCVDRQQSVCARKYNTQLQSCFVILLFLSRVQENKNRPGATAMPTSPPLFVCADHSPPSYPTERPPPTGHSWCIPRCRTEEGKVPGASSGTSCRRTLR